MPAQANLLYKVTVSDERVLRHIWWSGQYASEWLTAILRFLKWRRSLVKPGKLSLSRYRRPYRRLGCQRLTGQAGSFSTHLELYGAIGCAPKALSYLNGIRYRTGEKGAPKKLTHQTNQSVYLPIAMVMINNCWDSDRLSLWINNELKTTWSTIHQQLRIINIHHLVNVIIDDD